MAAHSEIERYINDLQTAESFGIMPTPERLTPLS